ncbi:MAG: DUF1573 domain-containing protein [Verrucomicrobia bacterium]|nr:DUF1573 domain-containing protein [Verrucomicrobiota bacterium]
MKLLPSIIFCFCASSAFAQLTWEQTEQTFDATPEDGSVVARYKFTNTGSKPIKIQSVLTSCGCTTAALAKNEYAPGESGEIATRYAFYGHTGRQDKRIMVSTSAAPGQPTVLKLHVNIQERVSVVPQLVLWRVGEQPGPKAIRIAVAGDTAVKIVSVSSDNPAIKVKLKEVIPGKAYEAQVTPESLTQQAAATLIIRTDYPPGNPQMKYAYARVK